MSDGLISYILCDASHLRIWDKMVNVPCTVKGLLHNSSHQLPEVVNRCYRPPADFSYIYVHPSTLVCDDIQLLSMIRYSCSLGRISHECQLFFGNISVFTK